MKQKIKFSEEKVVQLNKLNGETAKDLETIRGELKNIKTQEGNNAQSMKDQLQEYKSSLTRFNFFVYNLFYLRIVLMYCEK